MRDKDDEDSKAFREAMRGVTPLPALPRVRSPKRRKPPARAVFSRRAVEEILEDSLELTPAQLDVEAADALSYRRDGVRESTLRDLRRGRWRVDDELDLHGMTLREAKPALRDFLSRAHASQARCLRIVHGKGLGSGSRGPVLKNAVNVLLRRDDAVIAFCSARQTDGGTGAIYVLLRT